MFDDARRSALIEAVRSASRSFILPRFRDLSVSEIRTKSNHADLVTLADTEAEAAITAAMRAHWPEAEVLGEEAVAADKDLRDRMSDADWAVVIDPVDGTWNFAKGLAVFGVIIAVLHRGLPVWGMLYDPLLDDWIEAGEAGATVFVARSGLARPLATSGERRPGRMTGYVPAGLFPRAVQLQMASEATAFARVTSLRCACHEYRMLAQGHVDFLITGPNPHPWDHAAGVLCVIRAGGAARFIDGEAYGATRRKGVILAASSEEVWQDLARRYAVLAEVTR